MNSKIQTHILIKTAIYDRIIARARAFESAVEVAPGEYRVTTARFWNSLITNARQGVSDLLYKNAYQPNPFN